MVAVGGAGLLIAFHPYLLSSCGISLWPEVTMLRDENFIRFVYVFGALSIGTLPVGTSVPVKPPRK